MLQCIKTCIFCGFHENAQVAIQLKILHGEQIPRADQTLQSELSEGHGLFHLIES
jgi:hypothetical protein